MNGDRMRPVLIKQPTLVQRVEMEQGRLALNTFGPPTKQVFYVTNDGPDRQRKPSARPEKGWDMTLFNFNRNNRLGTARVVADDDYSQQTGIWLSGRVLGFYISVRFPWRKRLARPEKG